MIVVGIETSCDETAVAIYEEGKGILSNVVSSQINLHKQWGGVYPELAAREHTKNIIYVLDHALKQAKVEKKHIDAVAFTLAPGLIVSLVIGASGAKALAYALNKPLIPVHHIEAHIFASFITEKVNYPFVALVVSGGHTELYVINQFEDYKYLGGTLDDAVGEAYDKVARMLNLGYPGGPIIDKISKQGQPIINFPKPLRRKKEHKYNFSFSGLKASVLREVQKNKYRKEDIAASFQKVVVEILTEKTILACIENNINTIVVAGGVSANSMLREYLTKKAKEYNINVIFPPMYLCTDNGAMVAYTGYKRFKEKGLKVDFDIQPIARIRMDKFIENLYKG